MKKIAIALSLLLPSVTFAQATLNNIDDVAHKATNIGNLIIAFSISIAVIAIIIGVVRYLIAGGEEERKKGGQTILWGVVGLFVILSIWGLVAILKNSFGTNDQTPINDINRTTSLPNPVKTQ